MSEQNYIVLRFGSRYVVLRSPDGRGATFTKHLEGHCSFTFDGCDVVGTVIIAEDENELSLADLLARINDNYAPGYVPPKGLPEAKFIGRTLSGERYPVNPFSFFQRKVCLTNSKLEWDIGYRELARVGLIDVQKFQAIPDIGPHQSFNRSTRAILQGFHDSGDDMLLFLEDDCEFKDLSHLEKALSELPEFWDIVYLGANLICWNRECDLQPERYSEHLFRVFQAWTTHAIGYSRRVVPFLLGRQPGFSEQMFDQFLSENLPNLNAYVVAPMVAYQRPRVSSIWDKPEVQDYTPIFEASDMRLK